MTSNWGMGSVVRGAEGSTGQSRSTENWAELVKNGAKRLSANSPAADADAFIDWLIDIGYPFNFTFDPVPPVDLDRLALRWKELDHWDESDEDAINCIREEIEV